MRRGVPPGMRLLQLCREFGIEETSVYGFTKENVPLQCAYSDFYVIDTLWPDMHLNEFVPALRWYERQDVTLGG